jgi:hypothetical protein
MATTELQYNLQSSEYLYDSISGWVFPKASSWSPTRISLGLPLESFLPSGAVTAR